MWPCHHCQRDFHWHPDGLQHEERLGGASAAEPQVVWLVRQRLCRSIHRRGRAPCRGQALAVCVGAGLALERRGRGAGLPLGHGGARARLQPELHAARARVPHGPRAPCDPRHALLSRVAAHGLLHHPVPGIPLLGAGAAAAHHVPLRDLLHARGHDLPAGGQPPGRPPAARRELRLPGRDHVLAAHGRLGWHRLDIAGAAAGGDLGLLSGSVCLLRPLRAHRRAQRPHRSVCATRL
mmetsp:Transcript_65181/g.190703  ORF Transcript_65181/g.190703 Transcript_65181/m.190703 type:complete len:237 (+) Transcript_65181:393-1103(+)